MEKKFSKKFSNFIKKEGFYVILFLCLCILATVAVMVSRNNRINKDEISSNQPGIVNETGKEIGEITEKPFEDFDNALQVKNDKDDTVKKETETKKEENKTAEVSTTVNTKFIKPVEGILARDYSEEPVYWKSTNSHRPNFGMDIKCEVGKSVVAVMEGKVESIETDSIDGVQVTINHQNGLKTVYANLDPKVSVTKDQTVKTGTKIGTVGKSTVRASYETYGDHLHFAVMKNEEFINPAKYIQY
ncbi:M23 family metallopeptidase [Clostridium sp. MSJ-11]|uniref:M23 family metallopeptidase n=1 Tax=Clostridium mobile TaxID=2841512 RepID=A0ABS6ELL3_9CLOT|nr:M23 family metallopeptidase [Clostridium mobile]MBU5486111.1 M23 family metallopeptidase [Clostridium mobile]